jgi:hypothetical protein
MTAGEERPRRGWRPPGVGGEVSLFARMAAFGLIVGTAYWFLTYETAGSIMLGAFGLASGVAGIAVAIGRRSADRRADRAAPTAARAAQEAATPAPGWAPLGIGIGLGGVGLGAVFGPWLLIAGLLVVIPSARAWLGTAMDESDAADGRIRGANDDLP